jgi:predicted nucleic acid-binding protein
MRNVPAGTNAFFFDTYALYALGHGSRNYSTLTQGSRIATSYMNLYELYYRLYQDGDGAFAEELFKTLISAAVQPSPESIKDAAKFRLQHVKKRFSYIDCLGYILAKELELPFLTGDEGFKGLPNVKFVKE